MFLHTNLTKLWRTKKFGSYPDPYPKQLPARLINCNSKSTTLPTLRIKLSITLISLIFVCLRVHRFIQNKERFPSEHFCLSTANYDATISLISDLI